MSPARTRDPYAGLIDAFNRNNVKYVIVGMSGINYYAAGADETFSTQDFDIFLEPTIPNIQKALAVVKRLDYAVAVKGRQSADLSLNDIVRHKATIIAGDVYGITFDLILAVSGYTFRQMECDARIFIVEKIPIKVGRLKKLLRSKKMADREKDKLFLKRYAILLKEME